MRECCRMKNSVAYVLSWCGKKMQLRLPERMNNFECRSWATWISVRQNRLCSVHLCVRLFWNSSGVTHYSQILSYLLLVVANSAHTIVPISTFECRRSRCLPKAVRCRVNPYTRCIYSRHLSIMHSCLALVPGEALILCIS
jgi:hypothetical protein